MPSTVEYSIFDRKMQVRKDLSRHILKKY